MIHNFIISLYKGDVHCCTKYMCNDGILPFLLQSFPFCRFILFSKHFSMYTRKGNCQEHWSVNQFVFNFKQTAQLWWRSEEKLRLVINTEPGLPRYIDIVCLFLTHCENWLSNRYLLIHIQKSSDFNARANKKQHLNTVIYFQFLHKKLPLHYWLVSVWCVRFE